MLKTLRQTVKQAISGFMEHKAMRLGAALAFYAMFSLGPVLVIMVVVAGFVWGERAARGELAEQFSAAIGPEAAQFIQQMIAAARQTEGGTMATLISIATLVFASTAVFAQLRDSLNTVWGVQPKPRSAIGGIIKERVLGFGVVLLIAAMLIALLAATTVISGMSGMINVADLPMPVGTMQVLEFIASWAVATLLFAAVFKWLPEVKIAWRDVWFGSIATALLFSVGKLGLGWYLGRGSVASVYGAAGSLVAILLWVYYSSLIFLFGAELTQAFARVRGKRIEPSKNAVPLDDRSRAKQGIPPREGQAPSRERAPIRTRDNHEARIRFTPSRARIQSERNSDERIHMTPGERFRKDMSRPIADFLISAVSLAVLRGMSEEPDDDAAEDREPMFKDRSGDRKRSSRTTQP